MVKFMIPVEKVISTVLKYKYNRTLKYPMVTMMHCMHANQNKTIYFFTYLANKVVIKYGLTKWNCFGQSSCECYKMA